MKKAIVLFLFAIATTVASFAQSYTPIAVEDPIYSGVIARWQFDPDGWGSDWEAGIRVAPLEGSYGTIEIIDYLGEKAVIATLYRVAPYCETDFECHVRPVGGGWSSWVPITVKANAPVAPDEPSGPSAPYEGIGVEYTVDGGFGDYDWDISGGPGHFVEDGSTVECGFYTTNTYSVKVRRKRCSLWSGWSPVKTVNPVD